MIYLFFAVALMFLVALLLILGLCKMAKKGDQGL